MPRPEDERVKKSQYADDMAIWSQASRPAVAGNFINAYLEQLHLWCGAYGIKVNGAKSQAISFHRSKKCGTRLKCNTKPKIHLNGTLIPYSDTIRFLGVQIDHKLTLNEHAAQTAKACQSKVLGLIRIANLTPLSSAGLKAIYRAYIESVLCYAAPALLILKPSKVETFQKI